MNFSAVILAGGKSSRMGRDKAWLEIGGQTLLARQIGMARALGALEVFLSGRTDADYSGFGCDVLHDKYVNAGPLAGIERALNAMRSPLLLVLAVDLPAMKPDLLLRLAAGSSSLGAIPCVNGRLEPLAALYPKTARELAQDHLQRGLLAVKDFASRCMRMGLAHRVEFPASESRFFASWNSPADLTRAAVANSFSHES